MAWTLYTKRDDGRYVLDDSLDPDERDIDPDGLIEPRAEKVTLSDGREVDAMVGEGGLAMVQE